MSSSRQFIILSAVVLLSATSTSAQAPAGFQSPITLPQLIESALANNRTIKIAEASSAKAGEDAQSARTRQWPDMNLQVFEGQVSEFAFTFRTGSFGTFPTTGPIPPEDTEVPNPSKLATILQFEFSQPLTTLWRIRANVRQLEIEREVMEQRRRGRVQAVVSEVRRQYYFVLEAQSGVAAADAGVALYQELYRTAREQLAAQTVFPADVLTVQAELARREHLRTTQRHALATRKGQLGVLVGRDIDSDATFAPLEEKPTLAIDLAAAEARAMKQRPDITEAELKVRQAEQGVSAKRAERIPDISLTARFLGLQNIEVLPTTVGAVGLFGSWQPFDWGRKRRDIAASGHVLAQATLALAETQALARVEVGAKYRQLVEARELITAAEIARRAADERLKLMRARIDAQSALRSDLLQAQASLAEADRDYRRALLAGWTAEADLQRAIGEM